MIVDTDNLAPVELPVYIDKTAEVLNWMKSKPKEELKAIWKCNDKIAEQNFNRLENMDLYNRLTPAVLAYEGIAFPDKMCIRDRCYISHEPGVHFVQWEQ